MQARRTLIAKGERPGGPCTRSAAKIMDQPTPARRMIISLRFREATTGSRKRPVAASAELCEAKKTPVNGDFDITQSVDESPEIPV
jgi:hypothetical protein